MVDPATPEQGSRKGKLHFVLKGKKLRGEWVLVRGSREPNQWIFFKVRDQYASPGTDITVDRPESLISGKLVEEIGETAAPSRKSSKKKLSKQPVTGTRR
jgi:bifunctional non-homologous end joining protein LigD